MRASLVFLTLILPSFSRVPAQTQNTSAPPAHPLTVAQLHDLLDASAVAEALEVQGRKSLASQKTQLPPWWPDSVWEAERDAILHVDLAGIYLPFYQPCYSEKEARMFIHLYSTPGGHAYARRVVGLEVELRDNGESPIGARREAIKQDRGMDPSLASSLDAADQAEAKRVFETSRGQAISACVFAALPGGYQAVTAAQKAAVEEVVKEHHAELVGARRKWMVEHPEKAADPH